MTKGLTLVLTLLILLSSCTTNQPEIETTKTEEINSINSDSSETTFSYQPKDYQEEIIDTLLDPKSPLRLIIKRYTLMDKGFEVPFEYGDNQTNIIHFRDFAVDIELKVGEKTIFSETVQKENFADKIDDKKFLPLASLNLVDLESYTHETGQVNVRCVIAMIESDYAYIFQLIIDKNGVKKIELKNVT
jgi:hypothetical protein